MKDLETRSLDQQTQQSRVQLRSEHRLSRLPYNLSFHSNPIFHRPYALRTAPTTDYLKLLLL